MHPNHVVALGPERVDNPLGKILVGEEEHLRWNRISFIFVSQVAGIGQAGQNILSRQPGITRQKFAFGLARREDLKDELDREARPSDHGFAGRDLRIHNDCVPKAA